jgi:hypothetical protein
MSFGWGGCKEHCEHHGICMVHGAHDIHDTGVHKFVEEETRLHLNPRHLTEHGIQLCFCGPGSTALPVEPLGQHKDICLIWDWAAASGKISPQELLVKIGRA